MLANKLRAATAAVRAPAIEDVFSTYLYTGNGSTQTITNGIDLAGEGGLVWLKQRSGTNNNYLLDSARGGDRTLFSNLTNAQGDLGGSGFNMTSSGFSINTGGTQVNGSGLTYASWTFRKAPRFFDVVTYTGTGSARTVSHNLGLVPGCIIVKRTDTTGDWQVYHRSNTANPETDYLVLNSTAATVDSNTRWNDTAPTGSVFTVGTEATVNASGGTYVAYLFAHDTEDDGVIQCGSYATDGTSSINHSPVSIFLGWEPQFVLIKAFTSSATNWMLFDNARGISGGGDKFLKPDNSSAESSESSVFLGVQPTSTGMDIYAQQFINDNVDDYIYIAIRAEGV